MRQVSGQQDKIEPGPLTEPVLLILISLADGPRHGYVILKEIESLTDGRVQMSTGTLFGAIRRLLEYRWIVRFEQQDTSRDKQAYRLTPLGRKQLKNELERLKQLTRAANVRMKLRKT